MEKQRSRKILSVILSVSVMLSVLPITVFSVGEVNDNSLVMSSSALTLGERVAYLDENGATQECTEAAVLTDSYISSNNYTFAGGWYVVRGDVSSSQTLRFNGETHLILENGSTLTASNGGIAAQNLTIYA